MTVCSNDLRKLLKDQDYRCALSGRLLNPKNCSIDHIEPISNGGTDELDNLQWVTKEVNRAKGTMSNEDFIDMCYAVVRYTKARKSLGSQK